MCEQPPAAPSASQQQPAPSASQQQPAPSASQQPAPSASAAPSASQLDLREAAQLVKLGWPQTLGNLAGFAPRLFILALVGHLTEGERFVAAAGIGIMYSNIAGLMLLKSTAFGAMPLYSQAFGAGNHRRVGHVLQRMLLIHTLLILAVSLPLTAASHAVLLACGQPSAVAADASTYIWWRLLGLPFVAVFGDLTTFLAGQRVVRAPMVANLLGSVAQVGLGVLLIRSWGFLGAPIAMTIVEIVQGVGLFLFTPRLLRRHAARSWPRWVAEWRASTERWGELIKLGLPCAVMIVSEWGGWESSLFIASAVCSGKESCPSVEAIPICTTLLVMQFLFCFGPGQAAVVRVGNLLGEGRADGARRAARVSWALAAGLAFGLVLLIYLCRRPLAQFFVDEPAVVEQTVALMPYTSLYSAIGTLGPGWSQQVLMGLAADLRVPAAINVVSIYGLGLPVGVLLCFRLGFGPRGLWGGLDLAMLSIVLLQYAFMCRTVNWHAAARVARERALERAARSGSAADAKAAEADGSRGLAAADSAGLDGDGAVAELAAAHAAGRRAAGLAALPALAAARAVEVEVA